MKKIILLLLLSSAFAAQAQTPTAKSPWTGATVKSSVPQQPVNTGVPVSNLPPAGIPNNMGNPSSMGQPIPMFPGQVTPGAVSPGALPPPEVVQDNVPVTYLGKVNGKIFTRTKDSKNYALVSPSLYKRVPKLDATSTAPMDGNLGNGMSGATGPGSIGNTGGLPSMVGGPNPNRNPANR